MTCNACGGLGLYFDPPCFVEQVISGIPVRTHVSKMHLCSCCNGSGTCAGTCVAER